MGKKKKLLTLDHLSPTDFPTYTTIPEIQKKSLLEYIVNKSSLKEFIPDSPNIDSITREYLLQVS